MSFKQKLTHEDLIQISDLLKTDKNIRKVESSSQYSNAIRLIYLTPTTENEFGYIEIDKNHKVSTSNNLNKDLEKIQNIVDDYFQK